MLCIILSHLESWISLPPDSWFRHPVLWYRFWCSVSILTKKIILCSRWITIYTPLQYTPLFYINFSWICLTPLDIAQETDWVVSWWSLHWDIYSLHPWCQKWKVDNNNIAFGQQLTILDIDWVNNVTHKFSTTNMTNSSMPPLQYIAQNFLLPKQFLITHSETYCVTNLEWQLINAK